MDPKPEEVNGQIKVAQNDEEKARAHDWLTPIEDTSVQLAQIVLNKLSESFEELVYPNVGLSEEDKKYREEVGTDFSISILRIMATTDIPADYATRGIDKLIEALQNVKNYIEGTIIKYDDEILSRYFGEKSPVTGTYMRDVATLGTIMLKLDKIRQETGGKDEDYFIIKK